VGTTKRDHPTAFHSMFWVLLNFQYQTNTLTVLGKNSVPFPTCVIH
jgi:hypothetical protein